MARIDQFYNIFQDADSVQIKYNLSSAEDKLVIVWKNKSNEWENVSFVEFTDDELKKEWVCLRTQFKLKYSIENASNYRSQLLDLLKATRTKICETNKPILKISNTEIVLKKDKGLVGIGKNAKISAAVQQTKTDQSQSNSNHFETLNIVVEAGEESPSVDDISAIFSSKSFLKFRLKKKWKSVVINLFFVHFRCIAECFKTVNTN